MHLVSSDDKFHEKQVHHAHNHFYYLLQNSGYPKAKHTVSITVIGQRPCGITNPIDNLYFS